MPYQRTAEVILARWREVERQLAEAPAGAPEAEWLQAEASRLRHEYHDLLDAIEAERRDPPLTRQGA